MFLNVVIKMHVAKELKVYSFMTVINENITIITYRKWDFIEWDCFTVIIAAVYIKMVWIIF